MELLFLTFAFLILSPASTQDVVRKSCMEHFLAGNQVSGNYGVNRKGGWEAVAVFCEFDAESVTTTIRNEFQFIPPFPQKARQVLWDAVSSSISVSHQLDKRDVEKSEHVSCTAQELYICYEADRKITVQITTLEGKKRDVLSCDAPNSASSLPLKVESGGPVHISGSSEAPLKLRVAMSPYNCTETLKPSCREKKISLGRNQIFEYSFRTRSYNAKLLDLLRKDGSSVLKLSLDDGYFLKTTTSALDTVSWALNSGTLLSNDEWHVLRVEMMDGRCKISIPSDPGRNPIFITISSSSLLTFDLAALQQINLANVTVDGRSVCKYNHQYRKNIKNVCSIPESLSAIGCSHETPVQFVGEKDPSTVLVTNDTEIAQILDEGFSFKFRTAKSAGSLLYAKRVQGRAEVSVQVFLTNETELHLVHCKFSLKIPCKGCSIPIDYKTKTYGIYVAGVTRNGSKHLITGHRICKATIDERYYDPDRSKLIFQPKANYFYDVAHIGNIAHFKVFKEEKNYGLPDLKEKARNLWFEGCISNFLVGKPLRKLNLSEKRKATEQLLDVDDHIISWHGVKEGCKDCPSWCRGLCAWNGSEPWCDLSPRLPACLSLSGQMALNLSTHQEQSVRRLQLPLDFNPLRKTFLRLLIVFRMSFAFNKSFCPITSQWLRVCLNSSESAVLWVRLGIEEASFKFPAFDTRYQILITERSRRGYYFQLNNVIRKFLPVSAGQDLTEDSGWQIEFHKFYIPLANSEACTLCLRTFLMTHGMETNGYTKMEETDVLSLISLRKDWQMTPECGFLDRSLLTPDTLLPSPFSLPLRAPPELLPEDSADASSGFTIIIVAAAIGIVVVIILLGAGVYFFLSRRKSRSEDIKAVRRSSESEMEMPMKTSKGEPEKQDDESITFRDDGEDGDGIEWHPSVNRNHSVRV